MNKQPVHYELFWIAHLKNHYEKLAHETQEYNQLNAKFLEKINTIKTIIWGIAEKRNDYKLWFPRDKDQYTQQINNTLNAFQKENHLEVYIYLTTKTTKNLQSLIKLKKSDTISTKILQDIQDKISLLSKTNLLIDLKKVIHQFKKTTFQVWEVKELVSIQLQNALNTKNTEQQSHRNQELQNLTNTYNTYIQQTEVMETAYKNSLKLLLLSWKVGKTIYTMLSRPRS